MEAIEQNSLKNISPNITNRIKSMKLRENSIFHENEDNKENFVELIKNERLSRNYLKITFQVKSRYFCTLCNNLLKQPVQSDCGCRFCNECYDQHFQLRTTKCPTKDCSEIEIINKHPDRAIEREMEKIPISCINDNCTVDMYLSFLYTHLRYCPESLFYCDLCFSQILLKNKIEHEKSCENRKIQCKFCLKEMSVYEAKNYHFNIEKLSQYCEKDNGKCPNNCSDEIHESIKFHLINKHADKYNLLIQNCVEIDERVSCYENKLKQLQEPIYKYDKKINFVKNMKLEFKNIKNDQIDKKERNEYSIYVGTKYVWKMTGLSKYCTNDKSNQKLYILSPPFYTEELGYKLHIKVYPCGDGIANGNHLSIFIAIAKGKYDPLLQWPFKHKFKLEILNQNNNKNYTECFRPDSDSLCYQKPFNDINLATGNPKFISFERLYENDDLIKDDTLFIKFEIYK